MNILNDVDLVNYSTMHLGGKAKHLVDIASEDELMEASAWANQQNIKSVVIGGGSNIIWPDEGYDGLVIVNKILGFEILEDDSEKTIIQIGAGEIWDQVVAKSCDMNLSGIECLSLIPGTAGATPVQNVGAYGQEISLVLLSIKALDSLENRIVELSNLELGFSYRSSILKTSPGRYLISSITLSLSKKQLTPPLYSRLQQYLNENGISDLSPNSIRSAVIAIRNARLPDPKVNYNCGSFFGNPIIDNAQYQQLVADYTEIPHWDMGEGKQKIAAAWLIETIGYKDYHDSQTGIATWKDQPLVLVNENAKSTADLLNFRDQLVKKVEAKFNISLVQEPELIN